MLLIEKYNKSKHLDIIQQWWKDYNWPIPDPQILPDTGYLAISKEYGTIVASGVLTETQHISLGVSTEVETLHQPISAIKGIFLPTSTGTLTITIRGALGAASSGRSVNIRGDATTGPILKIYQI